MPGRLGTAACHPCCLGCLQTATWPTLSHLLARWVVWCFSSYFTAGAVDQLSIRMSGLWFSGLRVQGLGFRPCSMPHSTPSSDAYKAAAAAEQQQRMQVSRLHWCWVGRPRQALHDLGHVVCSESGVASGTFRGPCGRAAGHCTRAPHRPDAPCGGLQAPDRVLCGGKEVAAH